MWTGGQWIQKCHMIQASTSPTVVGNFKKIQVAPCHCQSVHTNLRQCIMRCQNKVLQRQTALTGGSLSVNRKPADSSWQLFWMSHVGMPLHATQWWPNFTFYLPSKAASIHMISCYFKISNHLCFLSCLLAL